MTYMGAGGSITAREQEFPLGSNFQPGATTTKQVVTGWSAASFAENAPFSEASGVFTCDVAGDYEIEVIAGLDQYSGNNRTSGDVDIEEDTGGSYVVAQTVSEYHRQNAHGFGSYTLKIKRTFAVNEHFRIHQRNHSSTLLQQALATATKVYIRRIDP